MSTIQLTNPRSDFFSLCNLIYLALHTNRVPIIPRFSAIHHLGGARGAVLAVSEVFDLPALRQTLGIPLLEWPDVKDLRQDRDDHLDEPLGCWSTNQLLFNDILHPPTERAMGLDVAYWPLHSRMRLQSGATNMVNLHSLAALDRPGWRGEAIARKSGKPSPAPVSKMIHPPDRKLLCFDYLFFAGTYAQDALEYYHEYSPVWAMVGQHFKFRKDIIEAAKAMVHRSLGVPAYAPTPSVSVVILYPEAQG